MDFVSCHQPLDLSYRHKKFDKRQRSSDSITDTDVEKTTPTFCASNSNNYIGFGTSLSTISSCAPDINSPALKRPYTPYADSDSVSEYGHFKTNLYARSTPCKVGSSLDSNGDDSGISLTPRKRPHQRDSFSVALKRRRLAPVIANTDATVDLSTSTATRQLPSSTAAVLTRISEDKLRSICTYHGNMVRKFPKKERTPKDQERRDKNTVACRMSRRVKKLEHIAVEVQYKEFEQQHITIVEKTLRAAAYLQQLIALTTESGTVESGNTADSEIDVVSIDEEPVVGAGHNGGYVQNKTNVAGPMVNIADKNPFSIDYLIA